MSCVPNELRLKELQMSCVLQELRFPSGPKGAATTTLPIGKPHFIIPYFLRKVKCFLQKSEEIAPFCVEIDAL